MFHQVHEFIFDSIPFSIIVCIFYLYINQQTSLALLNENEAMQWSICCQLIQDQL